MNEQRDDAKVSQGDHAEGTGETMRMQQGARRLDAAADAIDGTTLAALARARREAASPSRPGISLPGWGGAGLGIALAASLTAVLVLPVSRPAGTPPADAALADLAAIDADDFSELALSDDNETALAEDLAFIAWLDENHDAG